MDKILWVKFGWSDFYRGGPVNGNFPWVSSGKVGHEAFNFQPNPDGIYYCYVPPQGDGGQPKNADKHGWTVICLAKRPGHTGIHVVGWYENATLEGRYLARPRSERTDDGQLPPGDDWLYSIHSAEAYFVPPDLRLNPFSHTSVKQGKYSFLAGPGVQLTSNKREVRSILQKRIKELRGLAIRNPDAQLAPDFENDPIDPLQGYGTAEHRKAVENAAIEFTKKILSRLGYSCTSRERDNIGFDLEALRQSDGDQLHVEVKGTVGVEPRFFMTANEFAYRKAPEWRLAVVTSALSKPVLELYTLRDFNEDFDLEPMVWKGKKKGRG